MKLSVRESGLREPVADHPLVDWSLPRLKELGYDGVELCITPRTEESKDLNDPFAGLAGLSMFLVPTYEDGPEGRKRIREKAQRVGLEIPTMSSDWAWGYADFNPDLSQWDRGVEILAEDAAFAKDVGAEVILIHFGTSTGSWDQAKRLLTRAAEHAAKNGVVFGVEGSIWFRVGLGPQETLCRMVDEIGSPYLKIYVHPQNGTEQQVKDVLEVGERICALHSSAINPEVDYGRVFGALKKVGYDWYWCMEVGGDLIAASVGKWRELARQHGAV